MPPAALSIALVLEHMDPSRGGCETYTARIASALAARGHKVTVLCHDHAWDAPGVEFVHLPRRGWVRTTELRAFSADVGRAVRGGRFDVVHAMLPVEGANVYQPHSGTMPGRRQASLRRRRGLKWASAYVTGLLNPYRRFLAGRERRLVADPRTICLCVSEMVAEQFRRHFGRADRLRVVFNGVDVPQVDPQTRRQWRQARRAQIGAGDGDVVLLTVATNFVLKGVAETVRAFARWVGGPASLRSAAASRGKARLVVIGHDPPARYVRLARALGVGGQVTFLPYTHELFQWYSAADACVLLSWYDSCSLVVLEAAAWGVPSITTAYNGAAEALAGLRPGAAGGAGIVVGSPRDTAAVVGAMDELADPARRAERSAACLRLAPRLSLDRHVAQLLDVYAEARTIGPPRARSSD